MKFACGTEITEGAECTGVDHANRPCAGVAVKGSPALLQPEYVFKNHAHGAVQPSLDLAKFKAKTEVKPDSASTDK